MLPSLKNIPLKQIVLRASRSSSSASLPIWNTISPSMKRRLLRTVQIGSVFLFALLPQQSLCVEAKKDDQSSKSDFPDWLKNMKDRPSLKIEGLEGLLAKSFEEGGSMSPLKQFFESGNAGKV